MRSRISIIYIVILCAVVLSLVDAPRAASQLPQAEEVPAFHSQAPTAPLPATMSPSQFNDVVVQNAYLLASRVNKVLYQQPCYCHCDRSQGHKSLLDCFASTHGSGCGVCLREAIYSYEQTHQGKTAAQIRAGIERGEWQHLDMTKYQSPLPAK